MLTVEQQRIEWLKCKKSFAYFTCEYVQIFNATEEAWVPFRLWPAQRPVARELVQHRQLIILKARQLGMTQLSLAYALHCMLFRSAATVLLFSRRDNEAMELLSDERIKGMYSRLPLWMQCRSVVVDNAHEWILSSGSRALAFSTSGADSFTASLVIVDEADIIPNLNRLMRSVKPTIDNGGQLILLSRVDKEQPTSEFKNIYRAARRGDSNWHPIFLPWSAHPGRTPAWYADQKQEVFSRTGGYDDLYEQYPETEDEALAPQQKDKRVKYDWIKEIALLAPDPEPILTPALAGLRVFVAPQAGHRYVIGADPAEGNPDSDDSAACVIDQADWRQVAVLAGRLGTSTFSTALRALAKLYTNAGVLVERNNHGHAILLALLAAGDVTVILGLDGRPGWLSGERGKTLMYDLVADTVREKGTRLYDEVTREQLASIEASTLRAPAGLNDDRADALGLGLVACRYGQTSSMA